MKECIMDKEVYCDMCNMHIARYDGKTKLGQWAYMCEECFDDGCAERADAMLAWRNH